jgi:hypothetical protein
MPAEPARAIEIFYCYAHDDKILLNELEKHLGVLKRQRQITGWHDRDIQAGKEWKHEIDSHLNSADMILLLISPDFISSEYCYSIEMHQALKRHKAGEAQVIPIILRPIDWEGTPFSKLQVLPTDAKPITLWRNRDEAFCDVARGIRAVVRELLSQKPKVQSSVADVASLNNEDYDEKMTADKQIDQTAYKMIDTQEAVNIFHRLMRSSTQMKVLCLVGEGKMGKSHLLTKVFPILARQDYQARYVVLDLRNRVHTIPDILQIASSQLGSRICDNYFAAYETWITRPISTGESIEDIHSRNRHLTDCFLKDLGKLDDKPLLLLFDSVNSAKKSTQTWLMDILLTQLASLSHVRVVIAGRSLPEVHGSYRVICRTYRLLPITDEQAYINYCRNLNARLVEQSIRDFAYACDYTPGIFADLILTRFVLQGIDNG